MDKLNVIIKEILSLVWFFGGFVLFLASGYLTCGGWQIVLIKIFIMGAFFFLHPVGRLIWFRQK